MEILHVENLKKIYTTRFGGNQVQALADVNFSVEKGEYVAIMGESGSGKTTLLNILAALDKPTGGVVLLDGKDITKIREKEIAAFRRNNLGFVFQDFNLLDTLTISENIALALTINQPKLILADEPTGALDSHSSQMLLSTIQSINETLGATILMVTHDAFSASYANRILFLRDGVIFTEILKGGDSRRTFFEKILDVLTMMGGGVSGVR